MGLSFLHIYVISWNEILHAGGGLTLTPIAYNGFLVCRTGISQLAFL